MISTDVRLSAVSNDRHTNRQVSLRIRLYEPAFESEYQRAQFMTAAKLGDGTSGEAPSYYTMGDCPLMILP
jgi:hypothetical protein